MVIGGGLLGLEAARGLQVRGCDVTVVHLIETLMERQLDATGGEYLKRKIESLGIRVMLPQQTAALLGNGHVDGLRFASGEEAGSRSGRDRRGHPAEFGTGAQGRPRSESRHRGQ